MQQSKIEVSRDVWNSKSKYMTSFGGTGLNKKQSAKTSSTVLSVIKDFIIGYLQAKYWLLIHVNRYWKQT